MKKFLAILLLAIVVVSVMSYSYAKLSDGKETSCSCGIIFTGVSVSDNELRRDIVTVSAKITPDGEAIEVCIAKAYPDYKASITFTIKNVGAMPVHVDEVRIYQYNTTALQIGVSNMIAGVDPCKTLNGSETIQILNGASQNWRYTFRTEIIASCQPQVCPRSLGFWKHEFCLALGGNKNDKNEQNFCPATLENYLDQITGQSRIFRFTGTQKQKLTQALNILQIPNPTKMEDKLKAQLLALRLNYVAGWTASHTLEGMTAKQIIDGSENALTGRQTQKYGYWEGLCECFNTKWDTEDNYT
jgi:hypothetical protein